MRQKQLENSVRIIEEGYRNFDLESFIEEEECMVGLLQLY